ncbi:MAG: DUF86 domain-containing protein [Nitrospiraceae bacterium]|nr:MAG: DUF86 domain-containing protein [Nitrospiraceae bacterium]
MQRDIAYVLDILLSAKDARQFTEGMDYEAFLNDRKCQLAVVRCLEVIGEATKRLSETFRENHPLIHWSEMAGMRDVLIHAYDRVDLERVWTTLRDDLPTLIENLEGIVPPETETK